MRIVIINGPNLNLTGIREPELYGRTTFATYLQTLKETFAAHELVYIQSNHEGVLIDTLHAEGFSADGIILNPGALAHTSLALADAIASIKTKVIEVHISNTHAREALRQQSLTAARCMGVVAGFGLESYRLALLHFLQA